MAIYPSIKGNTTEHESEKKILRSTFENGSEHTRPQYEIVKKTFTVGYTGLTPTEMTELDTFLMDNQGLSFTFVHPLTSVSYEVRNTTDKVKFTYKHVDRYTATVILKEI